MMEQKMGELTQLIEQERTAREGLSAKVEELTQELSGKIKENVELRERIAEMLLSNEKGRRGPHIVKRASGNWISARTTLVPNTVSSMGELTVNYDSKQVTSFFYRHPLISNSMSPTRFSAARQERMKTESRYTNAKCIMEQGEGLETGSNQVIGERINKLRNEIKLEINDLITQTI
jgi:hypothetical protein